MKKLKKLLVMMLAAAMVASLAACSSSSSSSSSDTTAAAEDTTEAAETSEETEAAEGEETEAVEGEETEAADSGSATFTINDDDPEVTIMVNHSSGEDTVLNRACLKFAELIEEYSEGKITVDVYPNGTLFSVAEMNEAIKDGSVQVIAGSPGSATATSLGIFELPNLVTSFDQAHEIMQEDNTYRQILDELFLDEGIRLLCIEPCDFRMLTSNKEVTCYEDLAGLEIRVMDSTVPMSYWAEWGANPTPIAWSEVYMSLQQGLVEAQENPYDSIISANLQEVQKYLIDTRHVMFYTGFMMNEEFYESLPENYQAIVDQASIEVAEYALNDAIESSDSNRQLLEDAGMTFIEFTDEDYEKMRENSTEANELV
ncbi:MAG: TRAP transporter substrate-binding protein [Lachnospiraceae bacterium]|nr:TRAP transporter substrate-binding protein [Lachnospiraceae bacterium]